MSNNDFHSLVHLSHEHHMCLSCMSDDGVPARFALHTPQRLLGVRDAEAEVKIGVFHHLDSLVFETGAEIKTARTQTGESWVCA